MSITEMAADELEAWELSAMRDPRNWVRPAAAVVVGSAAGRRAGPAAGPQPRAPADAPSAVEGVRESAESTIRDISRETRKLLGER